VLASPVFTSRARAWDGAALDVYRMPTIECHTSHEDHLVSVQATGGANLYQRRCGHETQKRLGKGEVIVTPAGEPKVWRRVGEGIVLVLEIKARFLDRVLAHATGRCAVRAELRDNFGVRDPFVENCAHVLWDELRGERLGGRMYAEAAITQLGLHLLRQYGTANAPPDPVVRISAHKLRHAKDYVEENLGEDLTVQAIARAAAMSPFHFAHAFSAAEGMPPHQYVMRRRLQKAKSLLRTTDLTLAQIAQRVGYASASHFCVAFQKATQVPPGAYRRAP
jgi:AraC family transcriptional regulator